MLVLYLILLYLYICLILLYLFTQAKSAPFIPSWPLQPVVPEALPPIVHCQLDADCESSHVCLGTTCVRKLLRGGRCDRATGTWISYLLDNAPFAICHCHNHQLYTQKFFGGDCTVNVACGVHGKYNPATGACHCDSQYTPVGLTCQRLPVLEFQNQSSCGPDELDVSPALLQEGFHATYLARLQPAKCVKRPCSFDALTGRPLKRAAARYVQGWGCVCDPRYGLFGVQLAGRDMHYLTSPGYDACASIFVEEPQRPMSLQYVTYFYLRDRSPLSVIVFEKLPKNYLTPFFRHRMREDPFMIMQSHWRYDFAQTFFQEHATFRARTRKYLLHPLQQFPVIHDRLYADHFQPNYCHVLYDLIKSLAIVPMPKVYELLYGHPVCRVASDDPYAHPMFRDRVVVNPHQLTYQDHDTLPRFNAFVLKFEGGLLDRWTLDLDYEHDIDKYLAFRTNAPDYSDAVPPHLQKPNYP